MTNPDYTRCSLEELIDVRENIDREALPERYAEVLRQIDLRQHQQNLPGHVESNPTPKASPEFNQSTFVTVVAWIFIVMSGFMTFVGVVQNLMVMTMFESVNINNIPENTPAFSAFIIEHFRLLFLAILLLSILVFVTSIALLKRHEWARKFFLVFLSFMVIYTLGAMIFTLAMDLAPTVPADASQDYREAMRDFAVTTKIIRVFTLVFSAGMAGLFSWLVWKLASKNVRAEFTT